MIRDNFRFHKLEILKFVKSKTRKGTVAAGE